MPVSYNSHAIIPGPFVQITKEFIRTEEGRVKRKQYNIAVKGKLSAVMGSPRANGTWWTGGTNDPPPQESIAANARMDALKHKMTALVDIFREQRKLLEIAPWNAQAPIKCNPWVKSIDFAEGKWFDIVDYNITLECDSIWWGTELFDQGGDSVEAEESWSVEPENGDTRTFRVTHSISSTQKESVDETGATIKRGWEVARDVVAPRIGASAPANIFPAGTYFASNYYKSIQIDEAGGKYTVQETYTYVWNQRWKEEITLQVRWSEGQTRVSVEGTVTGFAAVNENDSPDEISAKKYSSALIGWNIVKGQAFSRASSYSGITLNPTALSTSEGHQPKNGVITYSYEWDNRPTTEIAGALSETISVQNSDPTDVFASLTVLGKEDGPILQPIGTITAKQRTVSIEAVMQPATMDNPGVSEPNVDAIVAQYYPGWGALVTRNERSWVKKNGRFSRTVSWTYK